MTSSFILKTVGRMAWGYRYPPMPDTRSYRVPHKTFWAILYLETAHVWHVWHGRVALQRVAWVSDVWREIFRGDRR